MARGHKTGGRDFEPGNQAAKDRLPGDIKAARKLTKVEFERLVNKFIWLDAAGLKAAAEDAECTAFERMVGAIIVKAIEGGDSQRLEFLLNRLIGKVTEKLQVELPKPFVITRASGEQLVLGAEMKGEEE